MPKSNRLALVLLLGLGCGETPVESVGTVASVEIVWPSDTVRPGRAMQAAVRVVSAEGEEVESPVVTWRSLTPATVQVDGSGQLVALAPGVGTVRASVGTRAAQRTLVVRNPPVRTLRLDVDSLRLSLPTGTQALTVTAFDSIGERIIAPDVRWSSSATRIASVSTVGQVTAVAVGQARVIAQADAATVAAEVSVVADPLPTAPVIAAIAPALVIPGQTLVVNGTLFGPTPAANTVFVDGVPVPVTQASVTQLVLAMPAVTSFPCTPRRTVALQIGTSGGIGVASVPLEVATPRVLDRGAYAVLAGAAAHCLDLSSAPGRYRLAVTNVARALGAPSIAATLAGAAEIPTLRWASDGAPAMRTHTARGDSRADLPRALSARAHLALLEGNRAAASGMGVARTGTPRRPPVALVDPRLGELRPIRLPALGQPDLCTRFTAVTARVAWVGRRITILEDTSTTVDGVRTLAGTQDALYATIGAELDSIGWTIARRFGDPLVMDGRLDDDGRVAIVVTRRMNTILDGAVLAATTTCDLFPRAQFPASDMGEVIYAQMPTVDQSGDAPGTPARWRREMRATLVHELKHVAAYAERVVRGQPLEESWLEEATARQAEELYARAIYGHAPRGNVGFSVSLACEIAGTGCGGEAPRAMQPHLEALYEMLRSPTAHSPLGPTSAGDLSFYGSAWAFTRWAIDHDAADEAATFTALTTGGLSGLANLEARLQRSWEDLFPEWALAMLVDDTGVSAPARLTFPSWDLRSQFRGLCERVGTCGGADGDPRFDRSDPIRSVMLEPLALGIAVGSAPPQVTLGSIVPGGFAPVDLRTSSGATAVIGISTGGTSPATALRLAILRVE